MKRTALTRRTGLHGGGALRRITRLRPTSARRQSIAAERRSFVLEQLVARPHCEVEWSARCRLFAVDVHEPWLRSRGGPIVPSEGLSADMVVTTCRACHDDLHANPDEATARGLMRSAPPHLARR